MTFGYSYDSSNAKHQLVKFINDPFYKGGFVRDTIKELYQLPIIFILSKVIFVPFIAIALVSN